VSSIYSGGDLNVKLLEYEGRSLITRPTYLFMDVNILYDFKMAAPCILWYFVFVIET
jgi:hypothetical protein